MNAPKIITLRNGKNARLEREPEFNKWNDCHFVAYDLGTYVFTLYWPQMTFNSDGTPHPLDFIAETTEAAILEACKQ